MRLPDSCPCTHPGKDALHGTYLARVEVHWDVLKGRNRLLLLLLRLLLLLLVLVLLLALPALVHCMLWLLVERIGWGRLPWHVAGIQSNSLHRTEKASRSHYRLTTSSMKSWDLKFIHSDCRVITRLHFSHQIRGKNNCTSVFFSTAGIYLDVRLYFISLYISDCYVSFFALVLVFLTAVVLSLQTAMTLEIPQQMTKSSTQNTPDCKQ